MKSKNETDAEYLARARTYQKNLQKSRKPIKKKAKVPKKSKTSAAKSKERIQALIRKRALERDGGCVLRHYSIAGRCGPEKADGSFILQGEHLNGRANSISYGDMDNIVCLCLNHHFFFKKRQPLLYWTLIEEIIGPQRWKKVQTWVKDKTPHRMYAADWARVEEELTTNNN